MMAKKLNYKQLFWLLYLVRFDFVLYYCLSKSIDKPDTLSQRLDHGNSLHHDKNMILLKPEYLVVYALEELTFEREVYSFLWISTRELEQVKKKNW